MNEQMIEMLKKLAGENTLRETSDAEGYMISAYEASGGNYDDAYSMGMRDGEILLARELLKMLENQ
jgi:hypothetical protein